MIHKRQEIRDFLKDLFLPTMKNVFTSRDLSINSEELPAVTISTPEEDAVPRTLNGNQYIRTLTIRIEARPEVNALGADDSVDLLLAEIEALVFADATLDGLVSGLVLINSTTDVDMEAETPIGLGVLTFECKYFTS